MTAKRICIFGGSFNPVHLGHLLVAQAALEELELERVVFTPAAQSPFKPDQKLAPASLRLRMLRLALAGRPEFVVDDQEIARGGVSYTIDTVRGYLSTHAFASLYYVIGADHVAQLPLWREAAELARLVEFVVVPRPNGSDAPIPKPFRARMLKGIPFGLSSSQIRDRARAGAPIEWLVGDAVAEVIANNHLYL